MEKLFGRIKFYRRSLFLLFLFIQIIPDFQSYYLKHGSHQNTTLNNFTFGSCFKGFLSTRDDIFNTIIKTNPQLWIWLGDVTYLDDFSIRNLNWFKRSMPFNFTEAEIKFNESKNEYYYSIFHKQVPTIGIWDDHDFAFNDGNMYYPYKDLTKLLMLDFLDEPMDSERRIKGRGLYASYIFGNGYKSVKIILLDTRYDKNSIMTDDVPDMLGEEQWLWLENEMLSNETFTFLMTGTQFLTIDRLISEAWYPQSRDRMIDLLSRLKKPGVVFLSGDIHIGQIQKTFCVLPKIGKID